MLQQFTILFLIYQAADDDEHITDHDDVGGSILFSGELSYKEIVKGFYDSIRYDNPSSCASQHINKS
uniref:Uncharacterized protein n=1 Tax=Glossina palpalis gambiensis TaxID=67801 RepID=A0A1B0B1S7_9MUSC